MKPSSPASFRIGIDVGGTNTDAVVIDTSAPENNSSVLFATKVTTTPNVADGIENAIRNILSTPGFRSDQVASVAIGTTHFLNALVEHDTARLSRVAVLRLTKSFTREIPPFSGFPPSLRHIIEGHAAYASGGLKIDGSLEAPLVEAEIQHFCQEIEARGIRAVAIVGVFSPLDIVHKQEQQARRIIHSRLPGTDVVCSSEISNIGLIERENASILNAAIYRFAALTIRRFRRAILRYGLACPLFLTQNDGSMVEAAAAEPIRTIASGPTNSMRGAAYLHSRGGGGGSSKPTAGQSMMLVCDIGGTTSDIGMLLPSGYPRQGSLNSEIAGIAVNYAMPHVVSVGVGGGSVVRQTGAGATTLGKDSVGSRLREKSLVFGGDVMTATDVVVAAGATPAGLGDAALVKGIASGTVEDVKAIIKARLERAIDLVKVSPAELPLLVVGGGSLLAPDALKGVSRVIRPSFHDVANAVGAATAKISASVDIIQTSKESDAGPALEVATQMAVEKVLASGAQTGSIEVTEKLALPLPYVENKVRTMVKAVGDFSPGDISSTSVASTYSETEENVIEEGPRQYTEHPDTDPVDMFGYRPKVEKDPSTGILEWHVSELDLEWLAAGCTFLGCGGGGSPYPELLKLKTHLQQGHRIRIVQQDAIAADATVIWAGNMGSPAVVAERLSANECQEATEEVLKYTGIASPDYIMPAEIGGSNGLLPLSLGSSKSLDRPIVDADWMGRAFPFLWQTTIAVYNEHSIPPCAIASGDGRAMILTRSSNDKQIDSMLRGPAVDMGYFVGFCASPATGTQVQKHGVRGTLSQAWRIGRAVARASQTNSMGTVAEHIVEELGGVGAARVLFRGKIVAINSRLQDGFSHGEVVIEHVERDGEEDEESGSQSAAHAQGGTVTIPFQNENLLVRHTPSGADASSAAVIATVPDLIAVIDDKTGRALGIGEYQYGVRVTVVGVACSPLWSGSKAGLTASSPMVFGFKDITYSPIGQYITPRSVIAEFGNGD